MATHSTLPTSSETSDIINCVAIYYEKERAVFSVKKNLLGMVLQGIMMDLQQNAGFFQPSGICSEFNNVIHVGDTQTSYINLFRRNP